MVVDELAHTNVPGSRHVKRWQDVEELLAAGIDVFTTLNVQHLESRADTVRQITGVAVRETVPDSMIEAADEIQLVDLTPAQLRERLTEGKVYLGDRAAAAADNFFKASNLTALRELALRLTAERVDKQLRELREDRQISAIWRSGERLLVAVGASPFSTRLIRWTRRMAYALDAPWIAVNVETPAPLDAGGAEAAGGKSRPRPRAERRDRRGARPRCRRHAGARRPAAQRQPDRHRQIAGVARPGFPARRLPGRPPHPPQRPDRRLCRARRAAHRAQPVAGMDRVRGVAAPEYVTALLTVLGMTLAGLAVQGWTGYTAISLFYLTAVVLLGLFVGQGPILLAATLSALAWNFLFIPPIFTFRIDKFEDGLMFGIFFVIALVTGRLTGRLRAQERDERQREQRATALYQLTRAIAAARSADEVLRNAAAQVQELFGARLAIFTDGSRPSPAGWCCTRRPPTSPTRRSRAWPTWVFRNHKAAGRFTDTLPAAEGFYLPLLAGENCVGAMGVKPPAEATLPASQRGLLESFATQIALALDRERLRATEEAARLSQESEKLHRTLLDGVSHELKTPLTVIASAAENLADGPLVAEIRTATQRLQRLVNNLLDMTRLESGALRLRRDWCDPADLINAAREATADAWRGRDVRTELPAGLPLVRADSGLIQQALANLIHNACVHTPARRRHHALRRRRRGGAPGLDDRGRQRTRPARRPAGPAVRQILPRRPQPGRGARPGTFHRPGFRRGARRPRRGAQPARRRRALYDLPSAGTPC